MAGKAMTGKSDQRGPASPQPTFRSADESSATAPSDAAGSDTVKHGRIRPFLSEEQWKARRHPESVQDIVDRVMTGVGGGRAGPAASLGARWDEVVGIDFANKTAPGSCESGKLVVLVRDGATASKLRFNTNQILQNAAKIIGKQAVTAISFRVSPSLGNKSTT